MTKLSFLASILMAVAVSLPFGCRSSFALDEVTVVVRGQPIQVGDFTTAESQGRSPTHEEPVREVTTYVIRSPADLAQAIKCARRAIQESRQVTGSIPIPLLEVRGTGAPAEGGVSSSELVDELAASVDGLERVGIEATGEAKAKIKVIDEQHFQEVAQKALRGEVVGFSIVRASVAGGLAVVGMVSMQMPIAVVVVAGVWAAYVSGRIQILTEYHRNTFLGAKAIWDRWGDHSQAPQWYWKLAYGTWMLVKQAFEIGGYITALTWTVSLLGGPDQYFVDTLAWLSTTSALTGWSVSGEGLAQVYDVVRRRVRFRQNWESNATDEAAGTAGAIVIERGSQFISLGVAAVSVLAQVVGSGSGNGSSDSAAARLLVSRSLLIGLGSVAGSAIVVQFTRMGNFLNWMWDGALNCGRAMVGMTPRVRIPK